MQASVTKEIKGAVYQIGTLNAIQQFHVGRRLAPAYAAAGTAAVALMRSEALKEESANFLPILGPISEIIAKMSDEDSNFVLFTCLGAVQRQEQDGRWQAITPRDGGALMYQDVDLQVMLVLVMEVIRLNLGSFFLGLGGTAPSPSSSGPGQTS